MIGRLLRPRPAAWTLRNPPEWLIDAFGASPVTAGVSVSPNSALTFTAVYAAVRVLAESVASLPLKVYRSVPSGKEVFTDHPAYAVLHDAPNELMTSFQFREVLQSHLCTWGNAYSEIVWGRESSPAALWPLRPDRVVPRIDERRNLEYEITDDKGMRTVLQARDVLHIKGLGFDGLVGYSPIRMMREAIGIGLAAEKYGAAFYGNSAVPSSAFIHPGKLSDKAVDNLRTSWEAMHRGPTNAHRLAILREGLDIKTIGMPHDDAQFLETRKFQINEIARGYRLPPHMIGDLERATFTNIEQQALEFVIHSLRPWLVRWEQEINMKLLRWTPGIFCEFNVDGLLRGETLQRYQAHKTAIDAGWKLRNEVREQENMNTIDGLDDEPLKVQVVMDDDKEEETEPETDVVALARTVVKQECERLHRKEAKAVTTASRKYLDKGNAEKFVEWMEPFYLGFRDESIEALCASFGVLACLTNTPINVAAIVDRNINRHAADIRAGIAEHGCAWVSDCIGKLIDGPMVVTA